MTTYHEPPGRGSTDPRSGAGAPAPLEGAILRARGVAMRFGRTAALDGVDLDLPRDRVTVILGRNGAGKSTLLRLALGVGRPTAGRLEVLGRDPWREATAVRERVGFVPDVPDAPTWMTPREWLAFLAPHYPTFDVGRGLALLESLDVPADSQLHRLSRGEGMLAMLAAAIAPDPELLLLDEPFGGLDPVAREGILRAVIGEIRDRGRAVVLTTHDLDVAGRVADHVVVIERGRVRFAGDVDDVAAPADSGAPTRSLADALLVHLEGARVAAARPDRPEPEPEPETETTEVSR